MLYICRQQKMGVDGSFGFLAVGGIYEQSIQFVFFY